MLSAYFVHCKIYVGKLIYLLWYSSNKLEVTIFLSRCTGSEKNLDVSTFWVVLKNFKRTVERNKSKTAVGSMLGRVSRVVGPWRRQTLSILDTSDSRLWGSGRYASKKMSAVGFGSRLDFFASMTRNSMSWRSLRAKDSAISLATSWCCIPAHRTSTQVKPPET